MRVKIKSLEDNMNDNDDGDDDAEAYTSGATFPIKTGGPEAFDMDDMPNIDEEEREVNVMGAGKIMKKTASDAKETGLDEVGGDISINVGTNLVSSKEFNRASGSPLRGAKGSKKLLLKKFGDDVTASKSPGKDSKKKKKGPGGVDKETRD
jgi:hypothetical protein